MRPLSHFYNYDHVAAILRDLCEGYNISLSEHHESSDETSSITLELLDDNDVETTMILSCFPGNFSCLVLHEDGVYDCDAENYIDEFKTFISASIAICRELRYTILMTSSSVDSDIDSLVKDCGFSVLLRDVKNSMDFPETTILFRIIGDPA